MKTGEDRSPSVIRANTVSYGCFCLSTSRVLAAQHSRIDGEELDHMLARKVDSRQKAQAHVKRAGGEAHVPVLMRQAPLIEEVQTRLCEWFRVLGLVRGETNRVSLEASCAQVGLQARLDVQQPANFELALMDNRASFGVIEALLFKSDSTIVSGFRYRRSQRDSMLGSDIPEIGITDVSAVGGCAACIAHFVA